MPHPPSIKQWTASVNCEPGFLSELECHGEKKSGRKQDLINRVRSRIAFKKGIDLKIDHGKWYEKKGQERQTRSSMQPRNIDIPVEDWGTFQLPIFYGNVYQYLIESVSQFGLRENTSSETEDDDRNFSAITARPLRKGMNLMKVAL
eukprot:gene9858-18443_t